MAVQINTVNDIIINGEKTGLKVTQAKKGTIVYTPENLITGQKYQEHQMPEVCYSTAHDAPASGVAGKLKFEADVLALLAALKQA